MVFFGDSKEILRHAFLSFLLLMLKSRDYVGPIFFGTEGMYVNAWNTNMNTNQDIGRNILFCYAKAQYISKSINIGQ